MPNTEILFAFPSTSCAILGEKVLLAESLSVTVMPLPASIKAGCGICLRLPPEQQAQATEILNKQKDCSYSIYKKTSQNSTFMYTAL